MVWLRRSWVAPVCEHSAQLSATSSRNVRNYSSDIEMVLSIEIGLLNIL